MHTNLLSRRLVSSRRLASTLSTFTRRSHYSTSSRNNQQLPASMPRQIHTRPSPVVTQPHTSSSSHHSHHSHHSSPTTILPVHRYQIQPTSLSRRRISTPTPTQQAPAQPTPILAPQIKTISDLARYRQRLVDQQLNSPRLEHSAEFTAQFTPFQRTVLFPFARTLIMTAKSFVVTAGGFVLYHSVLNFMLWSRWVKDSIQTYHPELVLTPRNVTATKLIALVHYTLQAAQSSVRYYIPTMYDIYFECYQAIYLPFKRFRLKELLLDIGTPHHNRHNHHPSTPLNETGEDSSLEHREDFTHEFKTKVAGIFSNEQRRRDLNIQRRLTAQQRHRNELMVKNRICTLTGNQLEDIYSVQRYCVENIQVVENVIRDLEKLYYGLETIYYGSFYNIKGLRHSVEQRKAVYQTLLDHGVMKRTTGDDHDGKEAAQQQQQHQQHQQPYYTNQQYYSLPTTSEAVGPIAIDNSFLQDAHTFDIIETGANHFYDKFLGFHFGGPTTQTQRLEDNVQNYLYNVYHHFVERLPTYRTHTALALEGSMRRGGETKPIQSLGMFWDFNIMSLYDTSQPQVVVGCIESDCGGDENNNTTPEPQVNFPLHSRQLNSASLSIFDQMEELSHATINNNTLWLLHQEQHRDTPSMLNPHSIDYHHQLNPHTLLQALPLPHNVQKLVYSALCNQLERKTESHSLNDLMLAATLNDHPQQHQQQEEYMSSLAHLQKQHLSPLPSMAPFSMEHKIDLQNHLKQIITDLKRIVVYQYDLHHRQIVPEDYLALQRHHLNALSNGDEATQSRIASSRSLLTVLEQSPTLLEAYNETQLEQIHNDINKYYQESIAHLTFNIALSEVSVSVLDQFTSFLSPLYLLSHPLYFTMAKEQFSPHLSHHVDRFVLNINQDGTLAFGSVPSPYMSELNHLDTKSIPAAAPQYGHGSIHNAIYAKAVEYAKKSTLLYQYKRSEQYQQQQQQPNHPNSIHPPFQHHFSPSTTADPQPPSLPTASSSSPSSDFLTPPQRDQLYSSSLEIPQLQMCFDV